MTDQDMTRRLAGGEIEHLWTRKGRGGDGLWGTPDDVPIALVVIDSSGHIVDFNRTAAALLDDRGQLLLRRGGAFLALVGPSVRKFMSWRNDSHAPNLQITLRSGGRPMPVVLSKKDATGMEGGLVIAVASDQAATLGAAQRLAFETAQAGMFVTDGFGRIVAANNTLLELIGLDRPKVQGQSWQVLFLSRLPTTFVQEVNAEVTDLGRWSGRVVADVPGRGDRVLEVSLHVHSSETDEDVNGRVEVISRSMVAHVSDVTDGSSVEQALKEQARRDQLTGVLNRAGFLEVLAQRFDEAQRSGNGLSLLYLDLDNFKSLNDHFGHRYGDLLLEAFSRRLQSSLKSTDVIGRVGGDEFVVLFDPGLAPSVLDNVVTKLRKRLLADYQLDEVHYTCTASFGSADYPWDASSADELLEFADHGMYQAKTAGRNGYARFDRTVFRNWAEQEERLHAIESGIERMQFVPYYQPIFDTETGEIRSAEALVRWIDPTEPDVVRLPGEFLPLVDGSPAGVRMGIRTLDQVLVHMKSFAITVGPISVSVNLSAAQLRAEDIVSHIERLAGKYPSEMQRLKIELVESSFYDGDPVIATNLSRISATGASLSLDDFGTGHSSLLSLRAHDFTQLKIDCQFLWAASTKAPEDVLVFESMVDLGRKLGLEIVSEGVETEEQRTYLRELGCDLAQGFHLGMPMPKDELRALLASSRGVTSG